MKNGKRSKRIHKTFLSAQEYNYKSYLVVKDTQEIMEFVYRETGKTLLTNHEK